MKYISFFCGMLLMVACNSEAKKNMNAQINNAVPNIIFETDIGNDIDDALALDMIYKYMDEKKINLLAVCSNKDSQYSAEYIHLMNHWYGYPDIPIGKVMNGVDSENDARDYTKHICLLKNSEGGDLFPRPPFNSDSIPDAVSLYRQILSKQKDNSVTIVSVGFSTNIVRLLKSESDQYSVLSGKELITQKVKLLSIMAGSFGENKIAEYNVVKDIPSAQIVADEWPSPIVYTPFEAGIAVEYPGSSIENDFTWVKYHPAVEAYKYYLDMPYDRPTWDLISLFYVVENNLEYFTPSPRGKVSVDNKGYTSFTPQENSNHIYLKLTNEQAGRIQKRFVEIVTQKPKNIKQ